MTATPGDANPDSAAFVRLHISPLDPDLLTVVLSSTLLPKARNISYHSIETFPEKRYGYLELPEQDADKLKRKLSGAVVKGHKIRIERAKPESILKPLGEAAMAKNKEKKAGGDVRVPKDKKRKRDAEIEGIVLEDGRKVKRGWTTVDDPKDKKMRKDKRDKKEKGEKDKKEKKEKKRTKSKYTDHEECLVKTILPAKGSDDATDATSKKKKNKSREVVVHEFEKTTKFPTFLKATATSSKKPPVEFVDGKGWVDKDGNVVDDSKTKSKPPPKAVAVIKKKTKKVKTPEPESESDESSASDSSSGSSSDSEDEAEEAVEESAATAKTVETKPVASADSPSLSKPEPTRPKSSGSLRNLTIQIPPATPPKEAKVHPLEALYKRPAAADGEAQPAEAAGFSFFGNNDDVDEDMEDAHEHHVPMTPFTRQDVETRGIRSAAPTPDTAHPARRFKPWEQEEDDINEDEDEDGAQSEKDADADGMSDAAPDAAGSSEAPTSDFQKWFWENRGNINRSWRKRRKTVGKEKRYRENRARMARAI
ncbi:hypothetical protein QBC34DRAFT_404351 [Podospora aff. communis PSN243]|uniref:RRM domain-containing protein n=1 Tax=Podospora aff. communis PSN243 TaxID=3040156 RepID=A0AAV9GMI7_9PEZI|nr:hypothetical protein QBC34DRAFT_404351 [Podospora aff. communis PSN243]